MGTKNRTTEEELVAVREQFENEQRKAVQQQAELTAKEDAVRNLQAQLDTETKAKQTAEANVKRARAEHEDLLGRLEDEEARLESQLRDAIAESQNLRTQLQTTETDKA